MKSKTVFYASAIFILILGGCRPQANRFLGTWYKITGPGADILEIAVNGDQYLLIESGQRKTGLVYKDGLLMIAGTFPITYVESSEHLTVAGMGGTGEYTKCTNRWEAKGGEPPGQTINEELNRRLGAVNFSVLPPPLRTEPIVSDGAGSPRGTLVYPIIYGNRVAYFYKNASGAWATQ